jgi:hypothetical protein
MGTGKSLENALKTRNTNIPFIDIGYGTTRVSWRSIYGRRNFFEDLRLTLWYVHASALQGKTTQNIHTVGQVLVPGHWHLVFGIKRVAGCSLEGLEGARDSCSI